MGKQICVIGNAEPTPEQYKIALEVGRIVAQAGHVSITGGRSGVMEAVARGAHIEGGISVGILPSNDLSDSNEFNTINIPTGMGYTRNALNIYAADLVLIVGGATGTLNEMTFAWMYGKPMYAIEGSGGYGEQWIGKAFDDRRDDEVRGVNLDDLKELLEGY
jgi:uncharacterized protein (TIGR00725 family)